MSDKDGYIVPARSIPIVPDGQLTPFLWKLTTSATTSALNGAAQNDSYGVFELPSEVMIVDAWLYQLGTLGASATAQLRVATTAISGATTAGGADFERLTLPVTPTNAVRRINVLIAGAAVGAITDLWVRADLLYTPRYTVYS